MARWLVAVSLFATTAVCFIKYHLCLAFVYQVYPRRERAEALPIRSVRSGSNRSTGRIATVQWASTSDLRADELMSSAAAQVRNLFESLQLALTPLFQPDSSATTDAIVQLCDELDGLENSDDSKTFQTMIRRFSLERRRYELLAKLQRHDYDAYVAVAGFLSPSRIPRAQLPNVQDVPLDGIEAINTLKDGGTELVADCDLSKVSYDESPLDKLLLSIFRKRVTKNTGGVSSGKPGIDGLLEQGRTFMLQEGQTSEAQHRMVRDTLGDLMTPVLPPFYRIFMSGIVPKLGTEMDGKQLGPWFYAPFLTSIVTPTFFGFLVGPSWPNRRNDGHRGGLVVEKCKFLQESGCKGLCLHQCKMPAQQFFADELGLPLTVTPNFATQECQWSFGEIPLDPADDPAFPKGCLVGCDSRKQMTGRDADICN